MIDLIHNNKVKGYSLIKFYNSKGVLSYQQYITTTKGNSIIKQYKKHGLIKKSLKHVME